MFLWRPPKWAPTSDFTAYSLFNLPGNIKWEDICPGVQLQRERSIIYSLMLGPVAAARNSWDTELFTSGEERREGGMSEQISDSSSPAGRKEIRENACTWQESFFNTDTLVCTKGCKVSQHGNTILTNERNHTGKRTNQKTIHMYEYCKHRRQFPRVSAAMLTCSCCLCRLWSRCQEINTPALHWRSSNQQHHWNVNTSAILYFW